MAKAYGIVTMAGAHINIAGMMDFRPVSAFSFLGRYRIIDFPISSMSNSDIENVHVYVSQNPRSLADHLGSGRIYNINSKRGNLQLLFNQDSRVNDIYNTDIQAYFDNMDVISRVHQPYVIITPGHMIFKQDYKKLLEDHVASGADITVLYHKVNNAKTEFRNCTVVNLNRQKGVKSIEKNEGNVDEKNIFMETYVMKNDLFIELINKSKRTSSILRLVDIINIANEELDIRGIQHKGYFSVVTDFKSYFDSNLALLDINAQKELFSDDWPIYTQTTDACPVRYSNGSSVRNSMVANGCIIEGTVEDSVMGRNVEVGSRAVIKNCIIMSHAKIDDGVHLENQVVDKYAHITGGKSIIATPDKPGYIRRNDVL